MIFYILTLFSKPLKSYLKTSIIGRAIKEKKICVKILNFRKFSKNIHKKVDDKIYGGNAGMLLKCQPLDDCISSIYDPFSKLIFLSPKGKIFNQKIAESLSVEKKIILVAGYYEGFDNRIYELYPNHIKLSIGNFILTNGILPSLVILDAVTRIQENILGNNQSIMDETFSNNLIEYPQYTRPYSYKNLNVPSILKSGNHKKIKEWNRKNQLIQTINEHPYLFEKTCLSFEDLDILTKYIQEKTCFLREKP